MYVYYINMQWPTNSETFMVNDVRALMAHSDVQVRVSGMKPLHKNTLSNIEFMGVGDISAFNLKWKDLISGVLKAISSPLRTLQLVFDLFGAETRWSIRLRTLVLIPSAYVIYEDIKKICPDVVHLFWGHYPCLVALLLQKDEIHPQISISLGAYDLRLRYGLSRRIISYPDVSIITYANANKNVISEFAHCSIGRVNTVYHGVSTLPEFDMRTSLPRVVQLLFVGRIIKSKGVYELIAIARGLVDAGLDFQWTIIGDGPELTPIKQLADMLGVAGRINFCGWMRHADVMAVMKQSDFFVFPSHEECIPNVVKEAMASGCLPIVSPTWAINELVDHQVNGWVTPDFTPESFIKALQQAIVVCADPKVYQAMQTSARQVVENRFHSGRNAQSYLDVWRKAIARRSDPVSAGQ